MGSFPKMIQENNFKMLSVNEIIVLTGGNFNFTHDDAGNVTKNKKNNKLHGGEGILRRIV